MEPYAQETTLNIKGWTKTSFAGHELEGMLFKVQRNVRIKILTKHIRTTYRNIRFKEFTNISKTKEESINN
jgi:hypothetical protein